MESCDPSFADRFENLLYKLKLVRGEGIVLDEIVAIFVRLKRHAAANDVN
jgi:hypothetical protein